MIKTAVFLALLNAVPAGARTLGCEEFLTHGQTASVLRLMQEGRTVKIFTRVLGQKVKAVVLVSDAPKTFRDSPSGQYARSQFDLSGRATRSAHGAIDILDQLNQTLKPHIWRLQAFWSLAKARVARAFKPKMISQMEEAQLREVILQHFTQRYAALFTQKRRDLLGALEIAVHENVMISLTLAKETRDYSPRLVLERLRLAEALSTENTEPNRQLDHIQDLEKGARRNLAGWLRTAQLGLGLGGMGVYLAVNYPGPYDLHNPLFAVLFANVYYEVLNFVRPIFDWSWADRLYPFRNVHVDARNRAVAKNLDKILRTANEDQILVVTLPERFQRIADQLEKSGFDPLPLDYETVDMTTQIHVGIQLITVP